MRPSEEAQTKCSGLIKTPSVWATQTQTRDCNKKVEFSEGCRGWHRCWFTRWHSCLLQREGIILNKLQFKLVSVRSPWNIFSALSCREQWQRSPAKERKNIMTAIREMCQWSNGLVSHHWATIYTALTNSDRALASSFLRSARPQKLLWKIVLISVWMSKLIEYFVSETPVQQEVKVVHSYDWKRKCITLRDLFNRRWSINLT